MTSECHGLAPAKLNLFLDVVRQRPDGYHDLATVMHTIDLADEITVRLTPRTPGRPLVTLCCDPPATSRPEQNLAHRAAASLLDPAGPWAVEIELVKRIPSGAGLGGGSSDAARVLLAVDRLAGGGRGPAGLAPAAARLGADVPFFLTGGTAICEGIGERVTPVAGVPPLAFGLVIPDFAVSTAEVYRRFRPDLTPPGPSVRVFARQLTRRNFGLLRDGSFNRLAAVARRLCPRLAGLERELRRRTGRRFQVTGSGSGLFAFCPGGKEEALELARDLAGVPDVAATHAVESFDGG